MPSETVSLIQGHLKRERERERGRQREEEGKREGGRERERGGEGVQTKRQQFLSANQAGSEEDCV